MRDTPDLVEFAAEDGYDVVVPLNRIWLEKSYPSGCRDLGSPSYFVRIFDGGQLYRVAKGTWEYLRDKMMGVR